MGGMLIRRDLQNICQMADSERSGDGLSAADTTRVTAATDVVP
jgi:hypothetical protein